MSGFEPLLVLEALFLGLRTIREGAEQAAENRTALMGLSNDAQKNVLPQLQTIQTRVKIHSGQEYIQDSINRLRECLDAISDLVEKWGRSRGRYKMMMDIIFGSSNRKMKAEIDAANVNMIAQVNQVMLSLQTRIVEGQDVMTARIEDLHAKWDAKHSNQGYNWSMSMNDVDYEKGPMGPSPDAILGSGGFSSVFRGVWKGGYDGGNIAIKALNHPKRVHDDDVQRKRFEREVNLLHELSHRNVVTFFGAIMLTQKGTPLYWIATELLHQSLADFLKKKASGEPDYPQVKDPKVKIGIISGITAGLSYLHSRAIVHRDIKPDNLMLDEYGEVKIIDFGMSKMQETHEQSQGESTKCGTKDWMSPEKQQGHRSTTASDVFSLGLVMANVLLLQTPSELKPKGGVELALKQSVRSNKDRLYQILCELAVKCIAHSPAQRPKCLDITSTIRDEKQSPGRIGGGAHMAVMVEEDMDELGAAFGGLGDDDSDDEAGLIEALKESLGSGLPAAQLGSIIRRDDEWSNIVNVKRNGLKNFILHHDDHFKWVKEGGCDMVRPFTSGVGRGVRGGYDRR